MRQATLSEEWNTCRPLTRSLNCDMAVLQSLRHACLAQQETPDPHYRKFRPMYFTRVRHHLEAKQQEHAEAPGAFQGKPATPYSATKGLLKGFRDRLWLWPPVSVLRVSEEFRHGARSLAAIQLFVAPGPSSSVDPCGVNLESGLRRGGLPGPDAAHPCTR